MPAVPPYIIEPIWQQFAALLPEREVDHPLGCHRPRACPIAWSSRSSCKFLSSAGPTGGLPMSNVRQPHCVAGATSGSSRERWTRSKSLPGRPMTQLYRSRSFRGSGVLLHHQGIEGGGERAGKTRWTGGREASNIRWLSTPRASPSGSSAPQPIAMTHRFWPKPWIPWRPELRWSTARGGERASGPRL